MSGLKVIFGGDVCFRKMEQLVNYEFSEKVLSELKPYLDGADLRVVNLENPLAPEGMGAPIKKSGPNLVGLPENIEFLKAGRFECAILANNHFGDYGYGVVENTLKLLDANGIGYAGGGMDLEEAYRAWRVEKKGVKLSVVAVCENEFGGATWDTPGSAGFRIGMLSDRIKAEKAISDYVVVVFHGGNEHNPIPSPKVVERYRVICDLGADAIIAMHTHCPQGWELYGGKPIIYSMGNFYFPWGSSYKPADSSWYYGYMTELTFDGGKITPTLVPYRCDAVSTLLHVFKGEEYAKFMEYIEKISAPIADMRLLEKYHKGWVSMSSYPKGMKYSDDFTSPDTAAASTTLAGVKNLLGCEAHNEVCATFLRSAFDGDFEEPKEYAEKLRQLQKMPV